MSKKTNPELCLEKFLSCSTTEEGEENGQQTGEESGNRRISTWR